MKKLILNKLSEERIFEIIKLKNENFLISDGNEMFCDVELTKEELLQLAEELRTMAMEGECRRMNMWIGVPASQLCNRHLYGVHGELHKFLHNWRKRHRIDKRVELHQMEPASYKARHDECAEEITRRGGNHQSPLDQPDFSYLPQWQQDFRCDGRQREVLLARCPECAKLINEEVENEIIKRGTHVS